MNAKATEAPAEPSNLLPAREGVSLAPMDALAEAFQTHQRELLGTIFHLVGNAEDANDVLQEAFLKCWRHRSSLAEITNLKAWIFHVALNAARDLRGTAWKRRRQSMDGIDIHLSTPDKSPLESAAEADEILRLRATIAELRPEEQEVFLLRQNGELTYEEIATTIGIPTGTVKTRMRLALEKLRSALRAND